MKRCTVTLLATAFSLLAVFAAQGAADAPALERGKLPVGSKLVRGKCATPDGKYVLVTHVIGRFWLPVTQVERGWCHNAALSVFDAATGKYLNTVLLDDPDLGAAEPWGVAVDEKQIAVAHCGSSEISLIDLEAFERRFEERKGRDLSADMSFMAGIRRRLKTAKQGPRKIRLVDGKPVVDEYLADKPGVTRGELLFNDARLCHQNWQSCAACHPDGKGDGMEWSFPRPQRFNKPEITCDFETFEMSDASLDERMLRSAAPALFVDLDEEKSREMGKYVRQVRKRGRARK